MLSVQRISFSKSGILRNPMNLVLESVLSKWKYKRGKKIKADSAAKWW